MNWYKITPCPDYAISEDGLQIKSIKTGQILNHNTAPYAKDGIRRVTLRYTAVYMNKACRRRRAYPINFLKQYIKIENLITGTDPDGGVIGEKGDDGLKFIK